MIEAAKAISGFLPSGQDANVPQNEPIFVLTATELRQIITAAVGEATKSILSQLSALQGRITSLENRSASIEAQEESDIGHLAESIGQDRRRLAALESRTPTSENLAPPTKKTTDHIDQLHQLMSEDRAQQVSIAKGARLLGISKERLRQLKPLILQDGRFDLGWSTVKGKKAVVIRIRKFL